MVASHFDTVAGFEETYSVPQQRARFTHTAGVLSYLIKILCAEYLVLKSSGSKLLSRSRAHSIDT